MRGKMNFKDYVAGYLQNIRQLILGNREKERKKTWKEPTKWSFGKVGDEWHFEWESPSGRGMANGGFNYCLQCMKSFEQIVLEEVIDGSKAVAGDDHVDTPML